MSLQQKTDSQDDGGAEGSTAGALDQESIDAWIRGTSDQQHSTVSLVYGRDGTGKSGLAMSAVNHVDGKVMLLDLDNSAASLLRYYDEETQEDIIVKSPQVTAGDSSKYEIDYKQTLARLRGALQWVELHHEEENIDVLVIDGLGKLKHWAEMAMRVHQAKGPEEGVPIRLWKRRNKYFNEVIEQAKALPLHTVYIGHEEFVMDEGDTEDVSALVADTNKLMHQKVHMRRRKTGNATVYSGEWDKNKYDVLREGQRIPILEVTQAEDEDDEATLDWKPDELITAMLRLGDSDV